MKLSWTWVCGLWNTPSCKALPRGFDDQHGTKLHRAQDFEIIIGQAAAACLSSIGVVVNNGDSANSGNGVDKPVGPAATMDDAGNGGVGHWITSIVGELEILGDSAILVLSFGGSQIHDGPPRQCVYPCMLTKISHHVCP